MKYIKSKSEFINESISVETNRYERSHGKKPRGFGQWAFYFTSTGGEPIFVPKAMSYSDAIKWAKGEAKKAGETTIYVGESLDEKRSSPYGEIMLDVDAAMKKAIEKGVTSLSYAKDYVQSLERMAKKNAKRFFKDYQDFTEDDWIEDVRYNMANEKVTENYDTEQRKEMASKGLALPDGSFPIKTVEDLKNAILAYGRAKDQSAAAKFIAKRAKALNADDLIPDTEDFQKALKEAEFGRIPKFGE